MIYIYWSRMDPESHLTLVGRAASQQWPDHLRRKMFAFADPRNAQLFLLGKLLLLEGMRELGYHIPLAAIRYSTFQRPFISDHFDFNISHAGHYAVCGFAEAGRIGVDIEELKPIDIGDFEWHWTTEELRELQCSNDALRSFYHLWTRKEAIVKADGRGLSLDLKRLNVAQDKVSLNDVTWCLEKFEIDQAYVAHFATLKPANGQYVTREVIFS